MKRVVCCLAAASLMGCVFSGSDEPPDDVNNDVGATDMAGDASNGSDVRVEDMTRDAMPDVGAPDMAEPDVGPADMGMADVGPPDREPSAVCETGTTSDVTAEHQYRLRVNTSEGWVSAAYVVPGEGADVLIERWSQWETNELWVNPDFGGTEVLEIEVQIPDPTGIASVPNGNTPGAIVTRRDAQNCIYAEWAQGSAGSLDCESAWGAEVANFGGSPVYFWFGEDGTISSMPADDFDPLGQRITVPWCAQDPDNPTDCLPLEYGTVDARANRGPHVMLSDSLGRAYVWNAVQNIDGSQNLEDCVTPPTPPVPLLIQGTPVMFENADIVRVGTDDFLVHQTAASVDVHELGPDLQPLAVSEQLQNSGLKPLFDATSDGTRIAAIAATGSDARVFAFGTGGGVRDVLLNDSANFTATAVGVAMRDNQVAVVAGRAGFFSLRLNAFVMWP